MENKLRRVCYAGHMGDIPSVISMPKKFDEVSGEILEDGDPLTCLSCYDKSLYYDSLAYWNESSDDLLCKACFGKKDVNLLKWEDGKLDSYIKVLTGK